MPPKRKSLRNKEEQSTRSLFGNGCFAIGGIPDDSGSKPPDGAGREIMQNSGNHQGSNSFRGMI